MTSRTSRTTSKASRVESSVPSDSVVEISVANNSVVNESGGTSVDVHNDSSGIVLNTAEGSGDYDSDDDDDILIPSMFGPHRPSKETPAVGPQDTVTDSREATNDIDGTSNPGEHNPLNDDTSIENRTPP